jgi:hypothetical protein
MKLKAEDGHNTDNDIDLILILVAGQLCKVNVSEHATSLEEFYDLYIYFLKILQTTHHHLKHCLILI